MVPILMPVHVSRIFLPWVAYLISALVAVVLLSGCSILRGPQRNAEIVSVLWEDGDQFVRIEKQDEVGGQRPAPNSHPVEFRPMQIRAALERVYFDLPGMVKQGSLFNPPEMNTLSVWLANGLKRARPDEDVTFLIHTRTKGWFGGYTGAPQITTGRVFYKNGILNIIFGAVRDSTFAQRYEINPTVVPVGYRDKSILANTGLSAEPGSGVYRPRGRADRVDWLVFFPEAYNAGPRRPPTLDAPRPQGPVPGAAPQLGSPAASTPAPALPPGGEQVLTPDERLRQLERLKRDGLITEEEYQYTRAQILKGL